MASAEGNEVKPISFRVESDAKKRRMKMRATQLGYDYLSEYIRALVDDDLDDAELPELQ